MDLLRGLNQNQKRAVLTTEGPLLVIAGAGTGKTKVVTHRISQLINQGIAPEKILAVTFTNKAAQEMRERTSQLTGLQQGPTIGTFHAIASDILKKHGGYINIPQRFSILDEEKSLEAVKSGIEELGLDLKQFRPASIQNLISKEKSKTDFENQTLSSVKVPETNESASVKTTRLVSDESERAADKDFFPKNFKLIWENYEVRLRSKNALDFDDLIQKTVLLFEEFPEILRIYQEKWPYIHVDEYQDTDPIQDRLVELLGQTQKNICAVGDEDQSIYGFRGADFTNILNFEEKWPETKIITLERNYRSTQKILDAANAVISKNTLRRPKNLYSRANKGANLTIFEAENEKEEADFIARKIKNLLQKEALSSSIAILCRANFQFPALEEAFLNRSIPYQTASKQNSLLNQDSQPVRLMTVHASKGLEFKYVFIPGVEKGLFPYTNADNGEERRLFYVALTRAEKKIFLSYSRYRTVFGSKQINQPSPYLLDVPKNLIKWA